MHAPPSPIHVHTALGTIVPITTVLVREELHIHSCKRGFAAIKCDMHEYTCIGSLSSLWHGHCLVNSEGSAVTLNKQIYLEQGGLSIIEVLLETTTSLLDSTLPPIDYSVNNNR